ncbi:MAG: hypothetical protein HZB55_14665 [Deltaproteobacteria bacterium]|nr:hypothetical protein [Deltaproteobacteria bacterium]
MTRDLSESCGCKTGFFRVQTCGKPATSRCTSCAVGLCSEHERSGSLCPRCLAQTLETPLRQPAEQRAQAGGPLAASSWSGSSSAGASADDTWSGGGGTFGGGGASGGWEAGAGSSDGPGSEREATAGLGALTGAAVVDGTAGDGFTAQDFAAMESVSDLRPDRDKGSGFES